MITKLDIAQALQDYDDCRTGMKELSYSFFGPASWDPSSMVKIRKFCKSLQGQGPLCEEELSQLTPLILKNAVEEAHPFCYSLAEKLPEKLLEEHAQPFLLTEVDKASYQQYQGGWAATEKYYPLFILALADHLRCLNHPNTINAIIKANHFSFRFAALKIIAAIIPITEKLFLSILKHPKPADILGIFSDLQHKKKSSLTHDMSTDILTHVNPESFARRYYYLMKKGNWNENTRALLKKSDNPVKLAFELHQGEDEPSWHHKGRRL